MYQTNTDDSTYNAEFKYSEMRNIILLSASALLLITAIAMFLSGVDDVVHIVGASLLVFVGTAAALLLTFSSGEIGATLSATVTRGIQGNSTPREMVTMIAMLSDLSRRVGLVGLIDIRTSSQELHEICRLLASAADEATIRLHLEKRREVEVATHKLYLSVLIFAAVYAFVIGILGTAVQYLNLYGAVNNEAAFSITIMLPAICGTSLALLIFTLLGRMNMAHLRERISLEVAYQGGAMILEDNNAERVHARLSAIIPPGMS